MLPKFYKFFKKSLLPKFYKFLKNHFAPEFRKALLSKFTLTIVHNRFTILHMIENQNENDLLGLSPPPEPEPPRETLVVKKRNRGRPKKDGPLLVVEPKVYRSEERRVGKECRL